MHKSGLKDVHSRNVEKKPKLTHSKIESRVSIYQMSESESKRLKPQRGLIAVVFVREGGDITYEVAQREQLSDAQMAALLKMNGTCDPDRDLLRTVFYADEECQVENGLWQRADSLMLPLLGVCVISN